MSESAKQKYIEVGKEWLLARETTGDRLPDEEYQTYIDQLEILWYKMTEKEMEEAEEILCDFDKDFTIFKDK